METDRNSAIPFALLCYGGDLETRLAMTSKFWISRLGVPLMAFVLTVVPSVSPAHAVEDDRKVSVVSFGLFGDQGVFKSEATGAAAVQFEERRRCNDRSTGHVVASGSQGDRRRE
jgi:hypothetical protein